MKKIICLFFFIAALNGHAQDYMDKIAAQSCQCLASVSDTAETQRMYMEMGLCMIKASEPYKKQLKKEHGIDMNNIEKEGGTALGKIVGLRMASICPEALMKISAKVNEDKAKKTKELSLFMGRVTKIEKDNFVIYTITDTEGKTLKFYWLTNIESNIEMINNYNSLFDTDVKVKYITKDFFDPKIGDYRNFNIIEKIEKLTR